MVGLARERELRKCELSGPAGRHAGAGTEFPPSRSASGTPRPGQPRPHTRPPPLRAPGRAACAPSALTLSPASVASARARAPGRDHRSSSSSRALHLRVPAQYVLYDT
ncbi:hypothetical protein GUJ93_ZPchr0013g35943 [Zizania palustris]|uniref:Uncharacterized protein n=1 Tax=Zizania palustris TaxID=103762 RepID=A0A8J6C369_ZIZPA|nr:hypothetical protein GUJ93_ZPchr0013g35943 [Zizania palustris]